MMADNLFDSLPSRGGIQAETWQEVTRLIGEYVVAFQEIEATLKEAIAKLLCCEEEIADIVCSELGFRQILKVFISLALHRMDKVTVPEDLNDLRKAMQKASENRNTVVHSQWIKKDVSTTSVLTFKGGNSLRCGYNGGYLDISIKNLYSDIETFKDITNGLRAWTKTNTSDSES